jgi:hypothetical protein
MKVWAPPVPRHRGGVDTSSHAFDSGFKYLEALLCNCLYTICGLHGHSGSWQDRACSASAILRHGMAMLPVAAENEVAHRRMLREVMCRVDNADNVLLHDPSCCRLTPPATPQSHFLARSAHC